MLKNLHPSAKTALRFCAKRASVCLPVFGEPVRSRHRQYLIRRIAWRLQANAEGGLTERARRRAEELADDADVRLTPPRGAPVGNRERTAEANIVRVPVATDPRLPPAGGQIVRQYKGRTIAVTVLADVVFLLLI